MKSEQQFTLSTPSLKNLYNNLDKLHSLQSTYPALRTPLIVSHTSLHAA